MTPTQLGTTRLTRGGEERGKKAGRSRCARGGEGDKRKKNNAANSKKDALGQNAPADRAAAGAVRNESVALTALANVEATSRRVNAAKLALAAWPRDASNSTTLKLPKTLDALGIVPNLRKRSLIKDATSADISSDGSRIVKTGNNIARVWDVATGKAIAVLSAHEAPVFSAFSQDGSRIVTASSDRSARLWDVGGIRKGNVLQVACALLRMHERPVSLEGVTQYPLTFDRPICETDPPLDPPGETAPAESRR